MGCGEQLSTERLVALCLYDEGFWVNVDTKSDGGWIWE